MYDSSSLMSEFDILDSPHGPTTMWGLVNAQMYGAYFPIAIREFGAKIDFRGLRERRYEFDRISVKTMLLAHPGNCLGYRVRYDGRSIYYITANELFPPSTEYYSGEYEQRLLGFVKGTDALIIDTNYFDESTSPRWGGDSLPLRS